MRHITNAGIKLIKQFESFSASVYSCPAGLPTIGYGHVIKDNEKFTIITEAQAEELLRADIIAAEFVVLRNIKSTLSDNQFNALVSLTYNIGSGALQRSTLRMKVNSGEHSQVPAEFMRWVWAGGRKLQGLIQRRLAEIDMYKS